MATELAKAYVQIVPSAKGISGAISKELGGEAKAAGTAAGNSIAGAIKTAIAAAGIGKIIKNSLMEGASLQQSIGGVETLFKDAADVVKKNADIAFSTAGLSANEYMEMVTGFAASLLQGTAGDTQKAAKIADTAMIDMADNANKMGTDMTSIQNAYQRFAKQNYTMLDNLKLGYGGTKTEMQRLLADAQALTGVKYDIENLADVYEAIHVIQGELDITGTTAKESEETFTGSFASMASAAKNLLGNLSLGQDIMPSLQALGKTVKTFVVGNLIPMVGNIIKGIPTILRTTFDAAVTALFTLSGQLPGIISSGVEFVKTFAQGLVNGIPQMTAKAAELRSKLLETVLAVLPDILNAGFDLIEGLAQGILNAAPVLMESIAQDVQSILDWLTENGGAFLERGFGIITSIAQGILDNAPELITSFGEIVGNVLDWLLEQLPTFLERGAEFVASLAEGLVKAIPDILTAIGKVIKNLLEKLTNGETLKKLFNAGIKLLKELVKGILSLIGGAGSYLWNNAGKIVTTIIDAIKSLFKSIFNTGVDLLKKIWEGIKSWFGTLFENAKEIPRKIISGIKELFTNIFNTGVDLLKKVWEGIKSWFGTLFENAKEIPGKIIEGIKAVGETILGVGAWIVETIWSGIESLGSWLWEGAKAIGGWIYDACTSDDVNQRMIDAGAAMSGEIAAGVTSGTEGCKTAARNLTNEMATEVENGVKNIKDKVSQALQEVAKLKEAAKAGKEIGENLQRATRDNLEINSPSRVYEEDIGHWLPPGIALGVQRNMKPFLSSMESMAMQGVDAFEAKFSPQMSFSGRNTSAADTILTLLLRYLPEIAEGKETDAAQLYSAINRTMGMAVL